MVWNGKVQMERKDTGCYRDGFRFKEQESPVCSENGEPVQMLTVGIAVRGVMDLIRRGRAEHECGSVYVKCVCERGAWR